MGVPKFYRWISERYPCLSEVVTEFQIPDFDNLYLDMNGIIHTCSHPNDDDPHFRITEEQIFSNICHYIEFLFKMIKPKKVFFMAVDGVAPRAKMNQQRGRRFRTAKTALMLEEQALACGEALPTDAKFDSNCITPGTPFMARLHSVLKDFAVYKVSTDKLWQNVRVFLSGHETPGEGEHKIMDFIRYEKSQPGYNPNTRHCLYGLDADLIMLGLCSHEPHFCLLREEVKFGGKKNQKRISTPEETTFHLLHISLLRDYLYHEFVTVKNKLAFAYDIEKIVDDFVLMSFLVGNDFIPHLPQLHIHHDALPVLFQTYMDVLPSLGGYLNEEGYLNLQRFQTYLEKLAEYDFQKFGELSDDFQYLERKSKSMKEDESNEKSNTTDILSGLGFSNLAISKMAEYDSSSDGENSEGESSTLEMEFDMHKTDYYMNKLEFEEVTPDIMKDQAEGYVRAIQWNLHYYYNGVVSWSWYYPHHYSPYISDVKNFKDMEMKFELGEPFLPFQQLLAVLPKLSKNLLPESYQKLMCDEGSPLIDFYPDDFLTDLNGKQQEWEAIVLIPFINEKLLLKCAAMADKSLTEEEKLRNKHGPHLMYTFNPELSNGPLNFLPSYSHIHKTHAELQEFAIDYFRLPPEHLIKGLCEGVVLDRFILGFPTLRTLKHSATLKNEKVKVFSMVSMKDNMMVTIEEPYEMDVKKLSDELLGKTVYVGYPHLHEALVVNVSDGQVKYSCEKNWRSNESLPIAKDLTREEQKIWARQAEAVEESSYQRWGIYTGKINILVFVKKFSGLKYNIATDGKISVEKQFEGSLINCAAQTLVTNIKPFSPDFKSEKTIEDLYPIGSPVFLLVLQYYGCAGKVIDNNAIKNKGNILVNVELSTEPNLLPVIQNKEELMDEQFMPGYIAAQQLGIQPHFFSCITGVIMIQTSPKGSSAPNRVNIGLNLKFNKKNEEVQGFSKKKDNQWLYSEDVIKTLQDYIEKFADFFEKLYHNVDKDVIYLEDLYPNGEGPEVLSQITHWLKEQTCSLAERQQCGMNKLDSGVINAIEKAVQNAPEDEIFHLTKAIKPNNLFNPLLSKGIFRCEQRLAFHLFDRVLNVRPSSSVPLGLKGTIIGIQKAEKESDYIYEILFDKEFVNGMKVPSGAKKGYRMPADALINLSHGQRLQNQNSPSKTARMIMPRLNRTAVFDSALKQLQPSTPVVQVQQKLSYNAPYQEKPFYKADSYNSFIESKQNFKSVSPDLTFYNAANRHFVTPNANRLSGGANVNQNDISPSLKNTPDRINSEFQNFWSNLKKRTPNSETPNQNASHTQRQSKSVTETTYGQKLSVEELFQGAKKDTSIAHTPALVNYTSLNRSSSTLNASTVDSLRQLCLEIYKTPPIYNYHCHGQTNLCLATIKLPMGEHVSSIPCATKLDAAANAAEKGLALLGASIPHHLSPSNMNKLTKVPPPNFSAGVRPYYFDSPQIPVPPFSCSTRFAPSVPNFPSPSAIPPFRPQCFDGPLMRHPQNYHSQIPDSFIKQNQLLLLPPGSGGPSQINISHPPKIESRKSPLPPGDVFDLPHGGTAIIRNTKVKKIEDNAVSNTLVPAQVIKHALKSDGPLSSFDWPDLPTKEPLENVPSPNAKVSPEVEKTKSFSEISKCVTSATENGEKPTPSHPSNMTVLKKKPKRRIAANFANL